MSIEAPVIRIDITTAAEEAVKHHHHGACGEVRVAAKFAKCRSIIKRPLSAHLLFLNAQCGVVLHSSGCRHIEEALVNHVHHLHRYWRHCRRAGRSCRVAINALVLMASLIL